LKQSSRASLSGRSGCGAWATLYSSKLPVTAVHLMNNDVIPAFEAHAAKIDTVLSDNGREYCGRPDQHPYELFLRLEEIEHRTIRVKRPQSSGIVERLHRTLLEHFRVEGRRTWFETIEEIQHVLDSYMEGYNQRRPHRAAARSLSSNACQNRNSKSRTSEQKTIRKTSRLTPPAHRGSVSRLLSLYKR
jgi:hypothetical protein